MTADRVGRVLKALGRKEHPMTTPRKQAPTKESAVPSASEHTVKVTADTSGVSKALGSVNPKFAPGEQTTEFWLTGLGVIAATILAAVGKLDGTAALAAITAAITGYSVSRGLAKR